VNPPIRILFDENFGEPLVTALAKFLAWHDQAPEISHLFEFANSSETDEVWIPRIAKDGWTLITTDRGKQSGGKKLPQLCCAYGVTHILLSHTLHNSKQFEKVRAVLCVWPKIIAAATGPKGARYMLRFDGPQHRPILIQCDIPAAHMPRSVPLPFSTGRKQSKYYAPRKRRQKNRDVPGQTKIDFNGHGG
jgi:PIN like domain